MTANTGDTDIGPLFPGVCLYFVCYAKTAGAGLWSGLSAGPHHLKLNNIPESGILRKCMADSYLNNKNAWNVPFHEQA